jgi:hypothetical protein
MNMVEPVTHRTRGRAAQIREPFERAKQRLPELRHKAGELSAKAGEMMHARNILRAGYIALPIIAGADKFFEVRAWERYLAPAVVKMLPLRPRTFMRIAGGIEIAAGALVAARPKIGAFVVAGWLGGIIANLAIHPKYRDVALRDFGLMLGAIALAREF